MDCHIIPSLKVRLHGVKILSQIVKMSMQRALILMQSLALILMSMLESITADASYPGLAINDSAIIASYMHNGLETKKTHRPIMICTSIAAHM
jgi:hypothetical protein